MVAIGMFGHSGKYTVLQLLHGRDTVHTSDTTLSRDVYTCVHIHIRHLFPSITPSFLLLFRPQRDGDEGGEKGVFCSEEKKT